MSVSVVCTCGATPVRDSFGNALPCMRCYFRSASQRPADRIAALEAELAEARRDLHEERSRANDYGKAIERERAAHERTKVELAAERADRLNIDEHRGRLLTERDAAQAEAAAMRDWCAAWLIRARLAIYREGWEEGMSVRETGDALTSVLFNLGCDDGSERAHDIAETKRLLAMPITYKPPAGRALAARGQLLEQKARFNDIRQRAALALFDRGFIEAPHEDGCPQDDTCDCPLMPLAQAVVNDDNRLQKVDAAAAEKALASLDEKGGG